METRTFQLIKVSHSSGVVVALEGIQLQSGKVACWDNKAQNIEVFNTFNDFIFNHCYKFTDNRSQIIWGDGKGEEHGEKIAI